MISIVSLIYKSSRFADSVWKSVHEHTPKLFTGEAEFFFVANDCTDELREHLINNKYLFVEQRNEIKSEQELLSMGYGWPEYIHRVYRGWNRAIMEAKDIVVLVSSDHIFSPNWLENLVKHVKYYVVACQSVELPKWGFNGSYVANFGAPPDNFDNEAFLSFVASHSSPTARYGGVYGPLAFRKDKALKVGLYPEGNLGDGVNWGRKFIVDYGDSFFVSKLQSIGYMHITAMDSIVYHFKEGEMRE